MFDDGILNEAHAMMSRRALKSMPAIDAMADPVARLWCRSFGVTNVTAIERLKHRLSDAAIHLLGDGSTLDDLQEKLDHKSEKMIRAWFELLLRRQIEDTTQALAIVRLAFLEANHDARWSAAFLDETAPLAEIAADMDAMMIEPTPQERPRQMPRQTL